MRIGDPPVLGGQEYLGEIVEDPKHRKRTQRKGQIEF